MSLSAPTITASRAVYSVYPGGYNGATIPCVKIILTFTSAATSPHYLAFTGTTGSGTASVLPGVRTLTAWVVPYFLSGYVAPGNNTLFFNGAMGAAMSLSLYAQDATGPGATAPVALTPANAAGGVSNIRVASETLDPVHRSETVAFAWDQADPEAIFVAAATLTDSVLGTVLSTAGPVGVGSTVSVLSPFTGSNANAITGRAEMFVSATTLMPNTPLSAAVGMYFTGGWPSVSATVGVRQVLFTPNSYGGGGLNTSDAVNPWQTANVSFVPQSSAALALAAWSYSGTVTQWAQMSATLGVFGPEITSLSVTGLPPGVTASTAVAAYNSTDPAVTLLSISGTPTASGSYSFTVTANGAGGPTATGVLAVSAAINPNPPTVSGGPFAVVKGVAASGVALTLGGKGTTVEISPHDPPHLLPAGLTLNADGTITGTATATGDVTVPVTATDNYGAVAVGTVEVAVVEAVFTSAATVSVEATTAFSFQPAVTAGSAVTWGQVGTQLTDLGAAIDAGTGAITGTGDGGALTAAVGTYTAAITATVDGVAVSQTLTIVVTPHGLSKGTSAGFVYALKGTAFSFTVTGDNSPTGYAATGLPAGLAMDSTGAITGTPTANPDLYFVSVTITNAIGSSTVVLVIAVAQIDSGVHTGGNWGTDVAFDVRSLAVTSTGTTALVEYTPGEPVVMNVFPAHGANFAAWGVTGVQLEINGQVSASVATVQSWNGGAPMWTLQATWTTAQAAAIGTESLVCRLLVTRVHYELGETAPRVVTSEEFAGTLVQ